MRVSKLIGAAVFFVVVPVAAHAAEYHLNTPFSELTPAQKTAAKRAATSQPIQPLVACADPANMPFSNKNGQGIQNRIMKVLASELDTTVSFFWQPADHRGMMHRMFDYRDCNLLLGVSASSSRLLETLPVYRSTYVFAYRKDSGIHIDGLDDPDLKTHSLAVVEPSAMRQLLARHGIKNQLQVVYQLDKEPWKLVQQVAAGTLDIAVVWGPFAGYAKAESSSDNIVLQPANQMSDKIPLEYSVAIGMRPGDGVLKFALDNALKHSAKQIQAILAEYEVPLVRCSQCIVNGDIPSHGAYSKSLFESPQARFLQPFDERQTTFDADAARGQIEAAIKNGRSANEQLFGSVVASEDQLATFLIKQYGANPDALDTMGASPLGTAANNRDSEIMKTLLAHGANPNLRDAHGFTPLLYAAHRNHAPSVKVLTSAGAKPDLRGPNQMTPLGIATGERNFFAAQALLQAGADVNAWSQKTHLTPLMLVASKPKSESRHLAIAGGMEPVELARLMIEKYGAKVGAKTTAGITDLMNAAAQHNAAKIGLLVQHRA
ncbi:MAG: ankyrin repeat domain-containing protein, partial [Salinisphaera sp.]|nr:ankyrin repeat domain-containing protein [Salinisphaera sp.]